MVWDRARASRALRLRVQDRVYTAARRRYGYYSLPILHNGALVGRLDAKAHRKQGTFEVKAIHLEPDTPVNDDLVSGLAGALRDCAGWHGTPEVLVRWSDPSELTETLRLALDERSRLPRDREDNLATTKSANSSSGQAESEDGNQAVCAYTRIALT